MKRRHSIIYAVALVMAPFLNGTLMSVNAGNCHFWKTRSISKVSPSLQNKLEPQKLQTRVVQRGNMLVREYMLNDSTQILLVSDKQGSPVLDSLGEYQDTYYHSRIMEVIGRDSVVLDEERHSISELSFCTDVSRFVYDKRTFHGEESSRGIVMLYDLASRAKRALHVSIGANSPLISPDGNFVLYSDYGDLFIFDIDLEAAQMVFNGGGSYLLGTGCIDSGTEIQDLIWSPNSLSASFRFKASSADTTDTLYELYWSP